MGDRTRQERDATDAGEMQAETVDAPAQSQGMMFSGAGMIPPVLGFPQGGVQADTASDIAFGVGRDGVKKKPSLPPLMDEGDLRATADRQHAEKLLKTKSISSPQDAVEALEILLRVDPKHQGQVIDEMEDQAFENLIDRLPDEQRVRLKLLVDASQKPKRKLRLWREQHMSRARHDLQRYEGDFGEEDDRTEKQDADKARYDRRKRGVNKTQKEVDAEAGKLLAKGDQLTVADIDKMRERKDKELDVEMKHNINLVAQDGKRMDSVDPTKINEKNPDVIWSTNEIAHLDRALDKLPDHHVHGEQAVETYRRKSNDSFMDTRGGEYGVDTIDIFDGAHRELEHRNHVDPIEYTVIHEVGHEVQKEVGKTDEKKDAFTRFEEAAGWETHTKAELTDDKRFTEAELEDAFKGTQAKGKIINKWDGHDQYYLVDDTALPSKDEVGNDRWKYASRNSMEHWAEMYVAAIETPDQLYKDYVERPAEKLQTLRNQEREQASALKNADEKSRPLAKAKLDKTKRELARAEKIVKQRRELFGIIRNDVFGAEKGVAAAVGRLKQKGASADAIRKFSENAARVSTPDQIEALEREAMK